MKYTWLNLLTDSRFVVQYVESLQTVLETDIVWIWFRFILISKSWSVNMAWRSIDLYQQANLIKKQHSTRAQEPNTTFGSGMDSSLPKNMGNEFRYLHTVQFVYSIIIKHLLVCLWDMQPNYLLLLKKWWKDIRYKSQITIKISTTRRSSTHFWNVNQRLCLLNFFDLITQN